MKILAASQAIINLAIGHQNALPVSHESPEIHFPAFRFADRAGAPHLFECPDFPYPLIIESYALSSQYDRIAECTSAEPIFALALNGEGFHGQHNRPWLAGKGNLHLCARIPLAQTTLTPLYQIIPSLAAARLLNDQIKLKWPNDLVLEHPLRKLGGALTGIFTSAAPNAQKALVIGIGLNLCFAPSVMTFGELGAAACFINAFDLNTQSSLHHKIACETMKNIGILYDEVLNTPNAVLDEYRARLIGLNTHVLLADSLTNEIVASGIFENIDDDFAICLKGHAKSYKNVRIKFPDDADSHTRFQLTN